MKIFLIISLSFLSFSLMSEDTLLGCKDTKTTTYPNDYQTIDTTMYSIVLKDIDRVEVGSALADVWDGIVVYDDRTEYYTLDDSETVIGWMLYYIRKKNIFLDVHTLNRLTGEHTTLAYSKPRETNNFDPIKERADIYKIDTYTAIAQEVSRCKVMEKLF
tara:strand:- start:589 stop:1068 length:480 start_codon:yes stop_codon:yes gene_type:complete